MLHGNEDMPALYQIMGDALLASGRSILYSLCQYGTLDVWKWGSDVGVNSWRTTGDISDRWQSLVGIGFQQGVLATYSKPVHFTDTDTPEIGHGDIADKAYRTQLILVSKRATPLPAVTGLCTTASSSHDLPRNV